MRLSRPLFPLISALLLTMCAGFAHAQAYTSIVVFGDSLSDTGNDAHLTQAKYTIATRIPGVVANYTDGRFTDGNDTIPAASKYTGVWVEQLAAMLPQKPVIKNSLDGGTDYAYGSATTGSGTGAFTFGPGNAFSVTVNNVGQQITDYLATKPAIDNKTLFVIWAGAIDLLHATSAADVSTAASQEVANVQRLIAAGATDIIIPNLPPLGAIPRNNGSPTTSTPATAAAASFNAALQAGLAGLPGTNPGKTLRLFQLDIFSIFNMVLASPSTYSLTNVTASSQFSAGVNPDNYLFWDDLHPTTAGHHLVAVAAAGLVTPPSLTASLTPTAVTIARGATGTSTVMLTPAGGYNGTATLACGTLPAHLSCSFAPASLTFTGTSAAQTSVVTIGTNASSALTLPRMPGVGSTPEVFTAFATFPWLGILGVAIRRRKTSHTPGIRLLVVMAMLSAGGALGLMGCGGNDNKAAAGSYTVPINVTANGSNSTVSLTVVVQ